MKDDTDNKPAELTESEVPGIFVDGKAEGDNVFGAAVNTEGATRATHAVKNGKRVFLVGDSGK